MAWCDTCTKFAGVSTRVGCEIYSAMMLHQEHEPEYPKEVQYGKDGHPVCLGYVPASDVGAEPLNIGRHTAATTGGNP